MLLGGIDLHTPPGLPHDSPTPRGPPTACHLWLTLPFTVVLLPQFAAVEIMWLADIVGRQQQQQQHVSNAGSSSSSSPLDLVPDSVLADAAAWLTFVIQSGESEQLAAVPIGEGCWETLVEKLLLY